MLKIKMANCQLLRLAHSGQLTFVVARRFVRAMFLSPSYLLMLLSDSVKLSIVH